MSGRTPAKPTGEKDDGPSKFIKRMKTVLRSGSRSNRGSVSSIGEVLGEPSKSKTQGATASSSKPVAPTHTPKKESGKMESVPVQQWSVQQQEKARALFAKYGLTLEPGEWMSKPAGDRNIQRIEKPIRMRVRRNCHRCLTTFGSEKVCPGCQHLRCKKCFRYPPAKPKEGDEKEKGKARAGGAPAAKAAAKPTNKIVLTIPSRTGGQDLVYKPPRQRIRRTCHRCQTLFIGDATECQGCNHIRCKKCPRDPPKLHKYPDGYPGDAEPPFEPQERIWRKPRRRIRWTCHSCNKLFAMGEKTCANCQHERCKDCTRDPPKKIKPEPDPELLRRVEEKLARLNV